MGVALLKCKSVGVTCFHVILPCLFLEFELSLHTRYNIHESLFLLLYEGQSEKIQLHHYDNFAE